MTVVLLIEQFVTGLISILQVASEALTALQTQSLMGIIRRDSTHSPVV